MNRTHLRCFLLVCLIMASVTSCKQNCYDPIFHQKHKNDFCQMDCPGVTGCDNKFYCNACIAATHGIRVK